MIELEVEGVRYEEFSSISVTRSLDTLSGEFAFEASRQENTQLPFSVGQQCKVFVDGSQVVEGFIDVVNVTYDPLSHEIFIQGRDKTSDVIDSTVGNVATFNGNISFVQLIEKTLENNGITGIDVTDESGSAPTFTAEDIESGGNEDTVFSFLENLARKRQVLLTTDGVGNIIITRSGDEQVEDEILNLPTAGISNILGGNISYDITDRFGKYSVFSQDNNVGLAALGSGSDSTRSYSRQGTSTDPEIRTSRQLNIIAEDSYNDTESENRAIWENNIRRVRSISYSVTIQGFTLKNGDLWQPNKLVQVVDEFAQLNAIMLINSVTYNFSIDSGSTTSLSLVDQDAYKVEAEKPQVQKRSNKITLAGLSS